jgi:aminopeptidase N
MPRNIRPLLVLAALLPVPALSDPLPVVAHDLRVTLDPADGTLRATDRLTLPSGRDSWRLALHSGLDPKIVAGDGRLEHLDSKADMERFRLTHTGSGALTIGYGGRIRHALEDIQQSLGRSRQWSPGTISPDGAVLDGTSGWYPRVESTMQRFSLKVTVPEGWLAVSQGAGPHTRDGPQGTSTVSWREDHPQEDIYLVAGSYTLYRKTTPVAEAQAFLRGPDDRLAGPYLDAAGKYLGLYSALIGPYAYAKFALVENFWETGYGMPSFTLLGPQVIRLPFIIHTSYPHEILHNWWGNGVYVDYASGNWSEGLTAYMADHLMKEQQGKGPAYRRDTLKNYADYVREGKDFPIRAFRSRHSSASQAVGYGKSLMVFNMLRRDLGDKTFVRALRRFYRENRFRAASFGDLRRAFETESGRSLERFFREWVGRTGAPAIALRDLSQEPSGDGYRLRGRLVQTQKAAPFPLEVPLVVHLSGGGTLAQQIPLNAREAAFDLQLGTKAVRVDADPRFDLFRRLEPGESPATLSGIFGGERGLIVLPANAPSALADAYRALAAAWTRGSPGWRVVSDSDLRELPPDRPAWLLGWSNRFLGEITAGATQLDLDAKKRRINLAGKTFAGPNHSVALATTRAGRTLGWIATDTAAALPGLAQKLPHYGKYSYLVFTGPAPTNTLKGQWRLTDSRLMVWLTKDRPALQPPPARPPLTAVLDELPAVGQ